jgi:hypothetical protein
MLFNHSARFLAQGKAHIQLKGYFVKFYSSTYLAPVAIHPKSQGATRSP